MSIDALTELRALSLVACVASVSGCGSSAGASDEALFPQQVVVEPCARGVAQITALGVKADPFSYKPSYEVRHFLVDLRIRNYALGVWLVVDGNDFPTRLNEVNVGSNGLWSFDGNAHADARWIEPGSEVTLDGLKVSTSYPEFPVTLGVIQIDGLSPRSWVKQGGQVGRRGTERGTTVPSHFFVQCTTWIDLSPATPGDDVRTPTTDG